MSKLPDHYKTLGVSKDATTAEIKSRYRKLVRVYHPDVAKDKEKAHKIFVKITEAYHILVDPTARGAYDFELRQEKERENPYSGPHATYSYADSSYNPASRQTQQRRQQRKRTTAETTRRTHAASKNRREPTKAEKEYLARAKKHLGKKEYAQALSNCRIALQMNNDYAEAFVLMGDTYAAMGDLNSASGAYDSALDIDPRDARTERKLADIMSRTVDSISGDTRGEFISDPGKKATLTGIFGTLALGILTLIKFYPKADDNDLAFLIERIKNQVPVDTFTSNIVMWVFFAAAIIGFLLYLNDKVENPDTEIWHADISSGALFQIPANIILFMGSAVCFPAAAGVYLVISILQGTVSESIKNVLIATACITAFAAFMHSWVDRGAVQMLLFGGNIAFYGIILGWYLASMTSPVSKGR
ncbi:MAG: DnaJ domain-containing protein [Abditibacteriota bacterium]|nr:DnaJ domain-containing protein [Abditibacteriota bacterium]